MFFFTISSVVAILSGCKGNASASLDDSKYGKISVETSAADEENETNTSGLLPTGFSKTTELLSEDVEENTDSREGYTVKDIPAMRISISLPEGATIEFKDKYNAIIHHDGLAYYLHKFYKSNFQSAAEVGNGAKNVVKATEFSYYDNGTYSPTVFDTGKKDVITTDKGFDIAQESPYIVLFQENTMKACEPGMEASYMLFQNDAYMIYAVYDKGSNNVSSESVRSFEADILSSMQYYQASVKKDSSDGMTTVSVGNGISFSIPESWKQRTDYLMYTAPTDSLYSGTSVYAYADNNGKYSTDALNLPTGITDHYLDVVYSVDKGKLGYVEDVLNYRQDKSNGITINVFDVKENLYPTTTDGILSFPSEGNELYSLRASFEDLNGTPCVIAINYTTDNENLIYGMFEDIESSIKYTEK